MTRHKLHPRWNAIYYIHAESPQATSTLKYHKQASVKDYVFIHNRELKENKKSGPDGSEIQAAREKERDGKGWKRELQLENLNTQG